MTVSFWDVICGLGLAWYAFTTTLRLISGLVTLTAYARNDSGEEALLTPGVTIIRPMKGLDPKLAECLRSCFLQDYSGPIEIILAVASADDPAAAVGQQVIAEFPEVDAKLCVGDVDVGPNPKVCNLVRPWQQAKHALRWMLDANVWTHPGTLRRSVVHFRDPRVNLVHNIPLAHALEREHVGARLDDVYLGTMHARMYAFINFCNIAPCVMGKSNMLRADALPDGIGPFAKYIAEDHLIACSVWRGRGTHVLANDPVRQPLARVTAIDFAERRIRWVRVRKYMELASTLVEPLIEVVPSAVIGCLSLAYRHSLSLAFGLTILITGGSLVVDALVWRHLHLFRQDELPAGFTSTLQHDWMTWVHAYLRRELTAIVLWARAMASDRIRWRGAEFVLGKDLVANRL
ncbi:Ceramide glucosyltransferase [Savitreella phatthalungensis]